MGRGYRSGLFTALGIDPASKRDRFDAALDLMIEAWKGNSISLKGTLFESLTTEPTLQTQVPSPLQMPHPPLAVAAFGPKGLFQAARRGLPYLASPVESFEQIRENHRLYEQGLHRGNGEHPRVVPVMRTVFVSEKKRSVRNVLENLSRENRPPKGLGKTKIPAVLARSLNAPLKERVVVGGAEEVCDRLAQYREEFGMNLLVVRPQISGIHKEEAEESLNILLEEILPRLCGTH